MFQYQIRYPDVNPSRNLACPIGNLHRQSGHDMKHFDQAMIT